MFRGSLAWVGVTVPNAAFVTLTFGAPNQGVLNRLNASNRACSRMFAGRANVLKNEKSINIRDLFLRLGERITDQELQSSREAFVQAELERVVIVHAAAMPRRTTVAAKKVSTAATNRLLIAARPGNPRPPRSFRMVVIIPPCTKETSHEQLTIVASHLALKGVD